MQHIIEKDRLDLLLKVFLETGRCSWRDALVRLHRCEKGCVIMKYIMENKSENLTQHRGNYWRESILSFSKTGNIEGIRYLFDNFEALMNPRSWKDKFVKKVLSNVFESGSVEIVEILVQKRVYTIAGQYWALGVFNRLYNHAESVVLKSIEYYHRYCQNDFKQFVWSRVQHLSALRFLESKGVVSLTADLQWTILNILRPALISASSVHLPFAAKFVDDLMSAIDIQNNLNAIRDCRDRLAEALHDILQFVRKDVFYSFAKHLPFDIIRELMRLATATYSSEPWPENNVKWCSLTFPDCEMSFDQLLFVSKLFYDVFNESQQLKKNWLECVVDADKAVHQVATPLNLEEMREIAHDLGLC
jgi:hypothetical protein